jgi:hypothetical protein
MKPPNKLMKALTGPLPRTEPPKQPGPATKVHVDRKPAAVRKTAKG